MAIYIILLITMMAVYLILNMLMHTLPQVEAGPIRGIKSTGIQRIKEKIPASYKVLENGILTLHRRFIVRGTCMTPANIADGSIVDVTIFNRQQRNQIKELIQIEDIVLIYINDDDFRGYKLRIVKEILEESAKTYYYKNGQENPSSKDHFFKDIIGVVNRP